MLGAFFILVLMIFRSFRMRWVLACCFFALISACSTTGSQILAAVASGKYSSGFDQTQNARLDPRFQYLRIEVKDVPPALFVLGEIDKADGGPVEVWYSNQGEVLRLQQGRIVGTAGLPTDWSRVWFDKPLPTWKQVPPDGLSLTRWHDQRQVYVGARQTSLVLRRIGTPASLPVRLSSGALVGVQWFEETSTQASAGSMPPSVYAVGQYKGRERVIYSTQCLALQLCLDMQLWPPEAMSP